jgi:hypothetical protein
MSLDGMIKLPTIMSEMDEEEFGEKDIKKCLDEILEKKTSCNAHITINYSMQVLFSHYTIENNMLSLHVSHDYMDYNNPTHCVIEEPILRMPIVDIHSIKHRTYKHYVDVI